MGGRRKRVHPERLLDVVLPFPPTAEQRRMVDLMVAFDAALDRARLLAQTSRSALGALVSDWQLAYDGPFIKLGELGELASGPSWSAADERLTPQLEHIRVLGITNTPPGGLIDLETTKYVSGLSRKTRLLVPGSLLMIRTNGNRTRIGNVYRVPREAYGCAFSAFQISINIQDPRDADFVYWMLDSPRVQRTITDNASGSTGLGNIAVRWLKDLNIPWPSPAIRKAVVALLDSLEDSVIAADRECQAARTGRTAVLQSLLSGERRIPDAYDALLRSS